MRPFGPPIAGDLMRRPIAGYQISTPYCRVSIKRSLYFRAQNNSLYETPPGTLDYEAFTRRPITGIEYGRLITSIYQVRFLYETAWIDLLQEDLTTRRIARYRLWTAYRTPSIKRSLYFRERNNAYYEKKLVCLARALTSTASLFFLLLERFPCQPTEF